MKLALENPKGKAVILSNESMEEGLRASRESPRRRMMMPLHREQTDPVQRMVNFLQEDTYVPPHLHPNPGSSETIMMISGKLAFLIFNEGGEVTRCDVLEAGDLIDIESQIWHGLVVLAPDTIFLEVKRGPFDPADRILADWAPPIEGEAAEAFLNKVKTQTGC